MSDEISKEWNEEHLISEMNIICPSNWDELEFFLENCILNHQRKQHFSFPLLQNVLKDINKVQVFEELIPFYGSKHPKMCF